MTSVISPAQSLPSSSWFDVFAPVLADGLKSRIVKDTRAEKIKEANPVKPDASPLASANAAYQGAGSGLPSWALPVAAVVAVVVLVLFLRR